MATDADILAAAADLQAAESTLNTAITAQTAAGTAVDTAINDRRDADNAVIAAQADVDAKRAALIAVVTG